MNRRTYLERVVAAGGLAIIAGCLGSEEPPGGNGSNDPEDSPVSILRHSFDAADPQCGQETGADVTVSNSTIRVDGSIGVSDLCQRATLVETTADDDTLHITIATENYQDMCGQCLAEASYELTVDLDREPESVEIAHDGLGGVETAATWSA